MKKKYNFIFFMVWGLLFGGIPLVAIVASGQFQPWILLFVVIGACAFIYGIIAMVKAIKDKVVLKHGKDGVGTFISAVGCGSVNNVPMFKIEFEYINDNGETKHKTTNEQYAYDEVELFKALEKFDIRYTDTDAVIKPNQKFANIKRPVLNNTETSKESATKQVEQHICKYCDTTYTGDKCPNCGASKNK